MTRGTLLLLSLFCLACTVPSPSGGSSDTGAGAPPQLVSQASVVRYDSGGQAFMRFTNQRYLTANVSRPGEATALRMLVRETSERHCCAHAEREEWGSIQVEAWPASQPSLATVSWRARIEADRGEIWNAFYRAESFGCCEQTSAQYFFNLVTGGPPYIHSGVTDGLPTVAFSNRLIRHAAFHDRYTPALLAEGVGAPDVVGVLQYGSPERISSRAILRRGDGEGLGYRLDSIQIVADGPRERASSAVGATAAPSGFAIRLFLFGFDLPSTTVSLPVVRDSLDLDQARLPTGFSLERVREIPVPPS